MYYVMVHEWMNEWMNNFINVSKSSSCPQVHVNVQFIFFNSLKHACSFQSIRVTCVIVYYSDDVSHSKFSTEEGLGLKSLP